GHQVRGHEFHPFAVRFTCENGTRCRSGTGIGARDVTGYPLPSPAATQPEALRAHQVSRHPPPPNRRRSAPTRRSGIVGGDRTARITVGRSSYQLPADVSKVVFTV